MKNYITVQQINENIDFVNLAITLNNVDSKSIDDMKIRAKIGDSVTELLRQFGCLEGMSQSNQLSLFG